MKWKCIFLIFLSAFGFAQPQTADSLKLVIQNAEGDAKAAALLDLAKHYQYERDTIAFSYAENAYQSAQTDYLKGMALYRKGLIYITFQNDPLQISYLKQAATALENVNDSVAGDALSYLAKTYRHKGMYPEALEAGLKELELRKKLPSQLKLAWAISGIGYTYDRMGDYEKAIEWHQRGLIEAKKTNNAEIIGRTLGLIGIAYDELERYDDALDYNFQAIEYFKNVADKGYMRAWYSNIGNTYTKKEDFDNAEKYTLMALNIDVPTESKLVTLVNLGKIYIETERYREAEKILDSALVLIKKEDRKRFLSEAYYRFHELRKKENNYKEALAYYEKYKHTEDLMLNEAKAQQIADMSVQYETAEKEKKILTQKAVLAENESKLKQKNILIYGTSALALVLAVFGYLLYKQQKLKNLQLQKENELKEALGKIATQNKLQEQRLHISRDLHDNIGAQLTFIISSLDNVRYAIKNGKVNLESKLQNISLFTSNTIYELRDTIWAMNKEDISFEDLYARIANYIDTARQFSKNINFEFLIGDEIDSKYKFSSVEGMNVYRIIQESVHNALKHAEAKNITVKIEKKESRLQISIHDDGTGFDKTKTESGNGLYNIRKRAKELKADLEIVSEPGSGTKIGLSIPLEEKQYTAKVS